MTEHGPQPENSQDTEPMGEKEKMVKHLVEQYTPQLTEKGVDVTQVREVLEKMLDDAYTYGGDAGVEAVDPLQ